MTKTDAERRLDELLLGDVNIVEVVARPVSVAPNWFPRLRKLRRELMQSLDDSIQELSFLDLSKDDFMDLLRGRALPENLSIRFRIPLEYGGELALDNMFVCPSFYAGYNMDRFILEQNGNANLWLPSPAKKIYIPTKVLAGGEGGNATSDRMTTAMASMMAQARENG